MSETFDKSDIVERATAALRDLRVPDGPSVDLLEQTLAAIDTAQSEPWHVAFTRRLTMQAMTKLALAAGIALFVGLLIWGQPWGGGTAFADVVAQIRQIKTARYTQIMRVTSSGEPLPEQQGEALVDDLGRVRFTPKDGGGAVMIMDPKLNKAMMLVPAQKLAFEAEMKNMPPMTRDSLLARLKKVPPVGAKEIPGKDSPAGKLVGFEIPTDGGTMRVWVDPKTRLPVEVEVNSSATGMMPGVQIVFKDFQWDVPVEESQLSTDPPEGYKLLPGMKLDMSEPDETAIVEGLSAIAELNFDEFPPGIDMESLKDVMRSLDQRLQKEPQRKEKFMSIGPGAMLKIGRMWMFVGDERNGNDWHYAGAGAELGQAGRAIFWYKPIGREKYRVIDADLKVRDVEASALPKIPASKIEITPQGQAK